MPNQDTDSTALDADQYGGFMTALFGLIDEASLLGYSPDAVAHMVQARMLFAAEYRQRHPDAWTRPEA